MRKTLISYKKITVERQDVISHLMKDCPLITFQWKS